MIDLHVHLLPGVDDGPTTWAEALELCRQLTGQGVTSAVATPHFVPGRYPETGRVLELVQDLNKRLCSLDCALTVYPGGEAYLDPELPRLVADKTVPTVNNAGRYLLLELPFEQFPIYTENVLFSLLLDGITPILAHPERNAKLREDPSLLAALVERGALVQVNTGSLAGGFGVRVQKLAEDLVRQGLAHLLGSDAHCPQKRPPLWLAVLPRLEKLAGPEAAQVITCINPEAVLAGDEIVFPGHGPAPVSGRSNFWGRALAKLRRR